MIDKMNLLICPGFILAKDGDRHFISTSQLLRLYRVNEKKHIIKIESYHERNKLLSKNWIVLRPLYSGKYEEKIKELKLEEDIKK